MNIEIRSEALDQLPCSVLVVFGFEGTPASTGTVKQMPAETRRTLEELQSSGELKGKLYECTLVHRPAGVKAANLLVVGAGKRDKFNSGQLHRLAGCGVRYLRTRSFRDAAWVRGGEGSSEEDVQTVVEGAIIGDYEADCYKTERNNEHRIDRFSLVGGDAAGEKISAAAAERGEIIAGAQNFTRDLVNEPSNRMTPTLFAQRAQEMAGQSGLECEVLGAEEIRELKMGGLLAVAQGSEEPAKLIVVRYFPSGAPAQPVVGLIGKGITFDSGGISIKPSDNMHEMKTDMAGGATMLGVMRAIARLKPNVRVMAVIPATENMPSGRASKPGDVVTSMCGKTIEIINTDAEGRMVLADALCYAKQLGSTVLIDAATLTGAVTIALGNITTGVFGWNQEWVDRILASASAAGENMWQLPVHEDYRDLYKSSIADLANSGGRYGGAIIGAMFIGEFAGDTPWVHLDIAGTRWSNEEKPYRTKGPTGHGVRTLLHLLTHLSA